MTRKEAIEILKDLWRTKYSIYLEADIRKALEMAIQALEQEPCKDVVISRSEAIMAIEEKAKRIKNEDTLNGLAGAIAILFDLPPVKPQPCEDAISRQAVQDYIAKYLSQYLYNDVREAVEVIDEYIGELPSVKPQEPTGHWITKIKSDLRGDMWPTNPKCSECGGEPYYSNTIYNYKFCPYCGVKMVEPQESEKINCKTTKCENCKNHNYCDYDPQERSDKE